MIPSPVEIAHGLYGAWRLAHLDRSAMSFFDRSAAGFWKSFFAAVLVLPAYALLEVMDLFDQEVTSNLLHLTSVLALSYVIGWLLYPVIMHPVCRMLDREEYFVGYIVAYNWAQVLQYLVVLPVIAAMEAGFLPGPLDNLLYFLALAAILTYFWHIARTALAIGGWTAIGIVLLDLMLSEIRYSVTLSLITGSS